MKYLYDFFKNEMLKIWSAFLIASKSKQVNFSQTFSFNHCLKLQKPS